jgi:hypothetical protein
MGMFAVAFGILLALVWIVGLLSLIATGAIFGWRIPGDPPLWASILGLVFLYFAFARIFEKPRRIDEEGLGGLTPSGLRPVRDLIALAIVLGALLFAYAHIPAIRDFFDDVPRELGAAYDRLRALLSP